MTHHNSFHRRRVIIEWIQIGNVLIRQGTATRDWLESSRSVIQQWKVVDLGQHSSVLGTTPFCPWANPSLVQIDKILPRNLGHRFPSGLTYPPFTPFPSLKIYDPSAHCSLQRTKRSIHSLFRPHKHHPPFSSIHKKTTTSKTARFIHKKSPLHLTPSLHVVNFIFVRFPCFHSSFDICLCFVVLASFMKMETHFCCFFSLRLDDAHFCCFRIRSSDVVNDAT